MAISLALRFLGGSLLALSLLSSFLFLQAGPALAGPLPSVCVGEFPKQTYRFHKVLDLSDGTTVEGFSFSNTGQLVAIVNPPGGGRCLISGTRSGNPTTILCDSSIDPMSPFQSLWGRPDVNDFGSIVFSAVESAVGVVYVVEPDPEGGFQLFFVDHAPVSNQSRPLINDNGQVAFQDDLFPASFDPIIERWDPGNPPVVTEMARTGPDLSFIQAFGIENNGDVTIIGGLPGAAFGGVLAQAPFGGGTVTQSSSAIMPDFPEFVGPEGEVLGFDGNDLYERRRYNLPGNLVNDIPAANPPDMFALGSASVAGCNLIFDAFTSNVGICQGGTRNRELCEGFDDCPGTGVCDFQCDVCVGGFNHGQPCSTGCGQGDAFCTGGLDTTWQHRAGAVAILHVPGEQARIEGFDSFPPGACASVQAGIGELDASGNIAGGVFLPETGENALVIADRPGGSANPLMPLSCVGIACRFGLVPDIQNLGAMGRPIYFDPDVAVGYDYAIELGPNFASVVVPEQLPLGDDAFLLEVASTSFPLLAGEQFDFTAIDPLGVSSFTILDIDPAEGLDPNDPLAFVTGVTLTDEATAELTMTAIVPEPGAVPLAVAACLMLHALSRRAEPRVSRRRGRGSAG